MMVKKARDKKRLFEVTAIVVFVLASYGAVGLFLHGPHYIKGDFAFDNMVPVSGTYMKKFVNPTNYIGPANPSERITLTIGLKWRNSSNLKTILRSINDEGSPIYHHFYTWEQFKQEYAPPAKIYDALLYWLESNGLHVKYTYPMRNAITIYDTIGRIEKVFDTHFALYSGDGKYLKKVYFAPEKPLYVPSSLQPYVLGIDGITSAPIYHTEFWTDTSTSDEPSQNLYGSTAPQYVRGVTGADLEYIYGANKLFNNSANGSYSTQHILPTKIRVATVLWEGTNSTNYQFAPFDPANVLGYYQNVTPQWIQDTLYNETGKYTSQIGWYSPDSNSAAPSSDVDGQVNVENELDLEMVGTLAPGVNVTLVYSNGSYYSSGLQATSIPGETDFPDQEYNYILNTLAPMTDRTLVAVSNSWGGAGNYSTSASNSVTMADVQALNAMGVTVMASSGDGGNTTPSWPAEAAYDTYGFLAVGGTTLVPNGVDNSDTLPSAVPLRAENLNKNDPIYGEYVWYSVTQSLFGTQVAGTECGVSSAYPEPSWQNTTIGTGKGGRVTADISAVGNRTIIMTSVQSLFGLEKNIWYSQGGGIAGTSVSSPVMAGLFADMAAYVGREYGWESNGIAGFGFVNPTIYHLGYDYYINGMYSSTPPFHDITEVYPTTYPAAPGTGYDMPTGWGTIDAWNFIHDIGFRITAENYTISVVPGGSGTFNLKVWYPYGWQAPVGNFEVHGLPVGFNVTFNRSYVLPPEWSSNASAAANLGLLVSVPASIAPGIYKIYVTANTYNTTTGQSGNLSYNATLTIDVVSSVPEIHGQSLAILSILFVAMLLQRKRRN